MLKWRICKRFGLGRTSSGRIACEGLTSILPSPFQILWSFAALGVCPDPAFIQVTPLVWVLCSTTTALISGLWELENYEHLAMEDGGSLQPKHI